MNVLIISDAPFARREAALLARLEAGLGEEGVRVACAVPARDSAARSTPSTLEYQPRGLSLTCGLRAAQLLAALAESRPADGGPPDVIHAFGEGAWPIAVEAARRSGAGLAVEVWCSGLCGRAMAMHAPGGGAALLLTPDHAVERALYRQGVGATVRVIPWGVPIPSQQRRGMEKGRALGVMVVGAGADRGAFSAVIEGLSLAIAQHPEVMVFVDALAVRAAGIWPLVRRLDLAGRITLAPDMEALRRLTLAGDILILPEALGEHRSLVLEAMASGLVVVAATDPMVSHLADRRTCRLVAGADVPLWADTLREVFDDADAARALAASAREFVSEQHRVSAYIGLVIDAYEWLASRDTLRMQPTVA